MNLFLTLAIILLTIITFTAFAFQADPIIVVLSMIATVLVFMIWLIDTSW